MAVYLGKYEVSSGPIINRPVTDDTYTKSEVDGKLEDYAKTDAVSELSTETTNTKTTVRDLSAKLNTEIAERDGDIASIQENISNLQNQILSFNGAVKEVLLSELNLRLNTYGASGLLYTDTSGTSIAGRTFRIEYGSDDNSKSIIITVNQSSSVMRQVDSYVGYDPTLKKIYFNYIGFYYSSNKLYANGWGNTITIGSDVADRAPSWTVRKVYEILK